MPAYVDQLQRSVTLPRTPSRIVSLVPSQTELLFDLGLDAEVVGITKFCVHPAAWFRQKTRVGGTKQVNIDKLRAMQPDLVIANKEENVREQIESIEEFAPVWTSDVNTVAQALDMISSIGAMTGREKNAAAIVEKIRASLIPLPPAAPLRAAYLIWKNPYMTIGGDTFIHDMMRHAGFENVFAAENRYPVTTPDEINARRVQVLLLSSEPFPFKEKDRVELQQLLPGIQVLLADGEMFSWYGSRMALAAAYFRELEGIVRRES